MDARCAAAIPPAPSTVHATSTVANVVAKRALPDARATNALPDITDSLPRVASPASVAPSGAYLSSATIEASARVEKMSSVKGASVAPRTCTDLEKAGAALAENAPPVTVSSNFASTNTGGL